MIELKSIKPLAEVKPIEASFILKDYIPLPVGAVTILNSEGGTGKSRCSLLIADRLSAYENGKSLLWMTEDRPEQVKVIFDEFVRESMVSPESQKDIYLIDDPPVQLSFIENKIFKINLDAAEAIANKVTEIEAKLLVLDPLLAFYGGNENDNSQACLFMQTLTELAKLTDIAILLIHHNRKVSLEGKEDFRGATAFHNECRMRYSLSKRTVDEYDYNAGYRTLRLEKDNWGGFKYWRKFTGGPRETKIKIAPAWEK